MSGAIGTYGSLFGDRADTFDPSSVMAGENADGTPRPIPYFGVTPVADIRPATQWTLTFCRPGETTGACSAPAKGGSFQIGTNVECPK